LPKSTIFSKLVDLFSGSVSRRGWVFSHELRNEKGKERSKQSEMAELLARQESKSARGGGVKQDTRRGEKRE
jgi:hypothetical protein